MKFRKGQKVRLVANKASSANAIGDVGIIHQAELNGNSNCLYEVFVGKKRESSAYWSRETDLELAMCADELEIF